jgi:hypothetical protein
MTIENNEKPLGALCATEVDAVSCSVPADSAIARHTPGPWNVYGDAYRFVIARPRPDHKPLICEAPDSEPTTPEERANVNLIAAAPEMYEALRGMLDQPESPESYDAMLARAQAALAKAEGRS